MNQYDFIPLNKMSPINQFVATERDRKLRVLAEDRDIFLGQCNTETQTRAEYAGREILELIQNADDASLAHGKIKIVLKNKTLLFYNSGKPFDKGGISSLLVPYNSSKGDGNIGKKGLGFRALLNTAKSIRIDSNDLSIRFSIEDSKLFYKTCNNLYHFPKRPPILNTPRIVQPANRDGYTTMITIQLKDDEALTRIRHMLAQINEETLLFLQKVDEITIDNGDVWKYTRKESEQHSKTQSYYNDVLQKTRNFTVVRKSYQVPEKNDEGEIELLKAKITLAYDNDLNNKCGYQTLYSYLKTQIQFPTNWLIHANFDLNTSRDNINKNKFNWSLLTNIVELIFEYTDNVKNNNLANACWDACDYVIGNYDKFDDDLEYNGVTIESYFMDKLRNAKILPTVNNKYISLNDEPYHFETELSKYLNGHDFEKLLKYADDPTYDDFVSSDAKKYDNSSIVSKINKLVPSLSKEDTISLSILYYETYKDDLDDDDIRPSFFQDINGQLIDSDKRIFPEPVSDIYNDLPNFVRFAFMEKTMYEIIRKELGMSVEKFRSSGYANFYGIREYSTRSVVQMYANSLSTEEGTAKDYARFTKWLFRNNISAKALEAYEVQLRLPTSTGDILDVNELYFSSNYGYDLTEKIWPDQDIFIANYTIFGLTESEKSDFINFLSEFGVDKTPDQAKCINDLTDILETTDIETIKQLLNNKELDLLNDSSAQEIIDNTAWLPIGDAFYSPRQIILNVSYGRKFDSIIGVNDEKLRAILGINLASELTAKLHLARKITDFTADEIYEVMLKLPEKDKKGNLARQIQHDLALLTIDEVNQLLYNDTTEYADFIENGLVFCKDGSYHAIDEVFYLSGDTMPSVLIGGRNLIDVSRKAGADKIKKLFGVERLTVDYTIKSKILSPTMQKFISDLKQIKTGLIASECVTTESETQKKIRALQLQLCRKVLVKLNSGTVKELNQYDFVVDDKKPSVYYLVVPENERWEDLRFCAKFIASVTSIIVARIGNNEAEDERGYIESIVGARDIHGKIELEDNGDDNWSVADSFINGTQKLDSEEVLMKNYQAVRFAVESLSDQYQRSLYAYLLDKTLDEQASYNQKVKEFKDFEPDIGSEIIANEDFDAKEYVIENFFAGLDVEAQNDCGNSLYSQLWQELDTDGERDILADNLEAKTLARFGHFEEAKTIVKELLPNIPQDDESGDDIDKSDQHEEDARLDDEAQINPSDLIEPTNNGRTKRNSGYSWIHTGTGSQEQKDRNGKKAQRMVYEYLRDVRKENVEDCSGYATKEGRNVDGNDALGYDLKYNDGNLLHYVEVKSCESTRDVKFTITENEYEKAEEYSSMPGMQYDIICVVGTNSRKPKYAEYCWDEIKNELNPHKEYHYHKKIQTGNRD